MRSIETRPSQEIVSQIKPDKPLKKDAIDLSNSSLTNPDVVRFYSQTLPFIFSTGSIGREVLRPSNLYDPLYLISVMSPFLLLYPLKEVAQNKVLSHKRNVLEQQHSIVDNSVGFRADRCVYQGKNPLKVSQEVVTKGDNFYFIQLPYLYSPKDKAVNQEGVFNLWRDTWDYSFKKLKHSLAQKDYKFVAINLPYQEDVIKDNYSNFENLPRKTIFEGKQAEMWGKDMVTLVFSKEAFEAFASSPQELFLKAVDGLGDHIFYELLTVARTAETQEERQRAKELLVGRLNQILYSQIEQHFNTLPEVQLGQTQPNFEPVKQRMHFYSSIAKTEEGLAFVKTNITTGEINITPLEKLLRMEQMSLEEIIASSSRLKDAQLAYSLYQMLQKIPFEELIRERLLTKEGILEKLAEYGIELAHPPRVDAFVERKLYPKKSVLRDISLGALAFALVNVGIYAAKHPEMFEDMFIMSKGIATNPFKKEHANKFNFPESIPQTGLDWKIDADFDTSGYFVTSTSHEFTNDWQENKEIVDMIHIPEKLESEDNKPYINLSKIQVIHPFYDTSFKIPLKAGGDYNTYLAALSIVDSNGEKIPYQVFKLTDGTIQVKIPRNLINAPAWVKVSAKLGLSNLPEVHASSPLKPLDTTKLYPEVLDKLKGGDNHKLFDAVRDDHEYSLNPPGKKALSYAETQEQVVNTIAHLHGCTCDVCNTEAVLASSVNQNELPINKASGYIASDNHPSGANGGFLKREAYHAFGIDEHSVIYDATPSNLGNDKMTKDYLELLHGSSISSSEDPWNQQNQELIRQADHDKTVADRLKLAGSGALAAATIFGIFGLYKVNKRFGLTEKLGTLPEKVITKILDEQDFKNAYNFFTWLSWSNLKGRVYQDEEDRFSSKEEALDKIKNTLNHDRLDLYLKNPRELERIAQSYGYSLTHGQAIKLRILAQYLRAS